MYWIVSALVRESNKFCKTGWHCESAMYEHLPELPQESVHCEPCFEPPVPKNLRLVSVTVGVFTFSDDKKSRKLATFPCEPNPPRSPTPPLEILLLMLLLKLLQMLFLDELLLLLPLLLP